MLNYDQLLQVYQRLGLSKTAQAIIESIRSSPPARRVRNGAGNINVRYPSQKMGMIIQAESGTVELAAIYEKEYDPTTLEYYDQPSQIKLNYPSKTGRAVGVLHTPDFFIIRTDGVGWEEWKTEESLTQLTDKMPHRYLRGEMGNWRCPPGEQYAEQFGFFYHVRSSAGIDWRFQHNLRFLGDYLRPDCPPVDPGVTEDIVSLVTDKPGITLIELLQQNETTSADNIYTLIAIGWLYVNLRQSRLAEPENVRVFHNAEIARFYDLMANASQTEFSSPRLVQIVAGVIITWDQKPWTIVNVGGTKASLLNENGSLVELPYATFEVLIKQGKIAGVPDQRASDVTLRAQEIVAKASQADLAEANRRYQIIHPILGGGVSSDQTIPARTLRDWLARYRQAEQQYGNGYVGLLPQLWRSGNSTRKLPEKTLELVDHFIENNYETIKQKSKREVYGELVRDCETEGLLAPSYKTFAQAVNQRPRYEQTKKRQGHRCAYPHEPFYFELTLTTPRHGDRPFEICHIDHTELDVELVCSTTGRNLGRPWATFLVDAFSRSLLAVYLSFDPPSYRSSMMILRECVRRHGRMPQTIVVDGGADFKSTYFETLLARYECAKKTRPSAKPRFGSLCERLFGTANTTFVHNLIGNTQITRNVRQVTRSVNPKIHARWTLSRLYVRLCEWAYDVYDTIEHPALGQSPRQAFASGLMQGGLRLHRLIPFDQDFLIWTLPTTRRGNAMVQPNRGVKINYIYYWADAFRDPDVERKRVPIRYDPFDLGYAYAYVKGQWIRSISAYYAQFQGRSEREIMLAASELHQQNREHGRQFVVTARKLAEFVVSLEAEEALLTQRLQDAEFKQALAALEQDQAHTKHEKVPSSEIPPASDHSKTEELTPNTGENNNTGPDQPILFGDF